MAQVLIVEDEFLIALELTSTLQSAGYSVLGPASSVGAALKILQSERPNAAVLDVNLRGEWVTPVAEVLKAMAVPFVLASGYTPEDLNGHPVLQQAANIGKPSGSQRLLRGVSELLGYQP